MGQTSARPPLDYDEAVARMGRREVAAVEEGFHRLAVRGRLSRCEFRTSLLNSLSSGAPVPDPLASALFDSFDSTASGYVTLKEFVCGLAVLRYGSSEEKLRLLFAAYDADRDQRLSDRDLNKFAHALHEAFSANDERSTQQHAVDEALAALATEGSRGVSFEHFKGWAHEHLNSPLVNWIFDVEKRLRFAESSQLSLASSPPKLGEPNSKMMRTAPVERTVSTVLREDASELEDACQAAGFQLDVEFAEGLQDAWRHAVDGSRFGVLDIDAFGQMLPSLPRDLLVRLFHGLDRNGSGTVGKLEFVTGLGACCHVAHGGLIASSYSGSCFSPCDAQERDRALHVSIARRELCFRLFAANPRVREVATTISADAIAELQIWAAQSASLFQAASARSSTCHNVSGLSREAFDLEPWASEVDSLMRGIGYIARIDLKLRPSPLEERRVIDSVNKKFYPERPGKVGETWFLICAKWWEQWCVFTGFLSGPSGRTSTRSRREELHPSEPTSIDNGALVERHGELRIGLAHYLDYEVITAGAWSALRAWYGGPGPSLPRQVIEVDGRLELEMYMLQIRVSRTDVDGNVLLLEHSLMSSRVKTVGEVVKLACVLHDISEAVVAYHRSGEYIDWIEARDNATLHELDFLDGHQMLLRLQDAKVAPKPSVCAVVRAVKLPVGLQNLGNTCYMNATLQCLFHTGLVSDYFRDQFRYDLNVTGTWGMRGKLAVAFSDLILETDRAKLRGAKTVAPRAMKARIDDFWPSFAGWKQQDAQEFLSILLSGISEDVNRLQGDKPFQELPDSAGRPDEEVAREQWALHCARECSAISASFSGQFRSVLNCNACGFKRASFDIFSLVPVPLEHDESRWLTCIVLAAPQYDTMRSSNPQHPALRLCVRVPKEGIILDLVQVAANLTGLSADDLIAADVADSYVFRLLDVGHPLSFLPDDAQPTLFYAPRLSRVASSPSSRQALAHLLGEEPSASEIEPSDRPCMPLEDLRELRGDDVPSIIVEDTLVFVHFVQRRFMKAQRYFLNPLAPELFSSPSTVWMSQSCYAADIYDAAWRSVRHLVPDMFPAKIWPFTICFVKRDGLACSRCSWRQACLGCVVTPPKSLPLEFNQSSEGLKLAKEASDLGHPELIHLCDEDTFSIDWDASVLQKHYRIKIATHVEDHETVLLAQLERETREQITQCLEKLTCEDSLEAYCKMCSRRNGDEYTETAHTKRLLVWGCPPLLVLQLQRFHHGDTTYKLHNHVCFPMRLDLTPYVAWEDSSRDNAVRGASRGDDEQYLPSDLLFAHCSESVDQNDPVACERPPIEKVPTNVADGFNSIARDVTEYELYAVIHHIGGSAGNGHYIANVKVGSKWFACNDAHVYEVSEEDVVSASAYLLFYARIDVAIGASTLAQFFPPHLDGARPVDISKIRAATWQRPRTNGVDEQRPTTSGLGASSTCSVM